MKCKECGKDLTGQAAVGDTCCPCIENPPKAKKVKGKGG